MKDTIADKNPAPVTIQFTQRVDGIGNLDITVVALQPVGLAACRTAADGNKTVSTLMLGVDESLGDGTAGADNECCLICHGEGGFRNGWCSVAAR